MKTSTWIILGVVAAGVVYYYWSKNDKTEDAAEAKAGFVSATDKLGTLNKLGTLSKNGL